jgi:hypothetical protein
VVSRGARDVRRRTLVHAADGQDLDTLEAYPARCAIAAEFEDLGVEIRELLVGKRHGVYRILFQIEGRTVQILRAWHGARDRVSPEDP